MSVDLKKHQINLIYYFLVVSDDHISRIDIVVLAYKLFPNKKKLPSESSEPKGEYSSAGGGFPGN